MARRRSSRTGAGVRTAAQAPAAPEAPRADYLVVARESARYDNRLMEGMVQQTLARFSDLPGRELLEQAGLGPLTDPGRYGTRPANHGRDGQWVLFEMGGTWAFYFMGSATKAGDDGDNLFCKQLCAALAWLRPRNVMISTFSRLVRSAEFSGQVYASALQHVDVIHADTKKIDLKDDHGKTFWHILSMFSTMERDSQMLRLTLGQIARYKQGDWLPGRKAVPLGYRLQDRKIVLDEHAGPVVRAVLEQVAKRQTSPEFVHALDALGLATPSQTGTGWAYGGGPVQAVAGRTVGRLAQPEIRRRQFENLVDLYDTGEYVFEWEVPVVSGDTIGGIPVKDATYEHGQLVRPPYVELVYRLPVPDGGWAPPDLLEHARAARDRPRIHDGHRGHRPLALALTVLPDRDGKQFKLASHSREAAGHPAAYQLFERPQAAGSREPASGYKRRLDGWKNAGKHVGRLVAVVDAKELHASIAQTVACGIAAGTAAERMDGLSDYRLHAGRGRGEATHAEQVRRLEGDLAAASVDTTRAAAEATAAVAALAGAGIGDDLAARIAAPAKAAQDRENDLRRRLAALRDAAPAPGDLGPEFTCEADMLVRILAAFAAGPARVPTDVARDVAAVVEGLAFSWDADWVTWSCRVLVPADGGWLAALGPFQGKVRRRGQTGRTVPAADRGRSLARALLRDGAGPDELHARDDGTVRAPGAGGGVVRGRQARGRARDWLVSRGMGERSASAALLCAVPQTRQALWAIADGTAPPDGANPAFVETLRGVYFSGDLPEAKWYRPAADLQGLLDHLLASGGSAMFADAAAHLARQRPDLSQAHVRSAIRRYAAPWSGRPGAYDFPAGAGCGRRYGDCGQPACRIHGLISLVACPHCGGWASRHIGVPEAHRALLCPDCRRSPDPRSGAFPAAYLDLTPESVAADIAARVPDVLYRNAQDAKARASGPAPRTSARG